MIFACPIVSNAQIEIEMEDEMTDSINVAGRNHRDSLTAGNSIDFPEALTDAIDSLLHLYNTEHYLKQDVDCDFPDVNPTYDSLVYQERLRKLPTVMELPYNNVVQQVIDRYAGRLRRSVSLMLGSSNFYMPIFEEALEAYQLPLELKYLPIIESALNPIAVSRVGATGLWQFMPATARQYGLEINSLVDERRDPLKSTFAAAHYLSDLYKIFGDWSLVIAAYNCGPNNVNKAIHRAGGVKDYWQIYPYLPRETRGYVPAFIAANYIMNYYCEHNICPAITTLPAKTDTVVVSQDIHFEQISGVLGVDIEQIKALNPQYRRNIVNGGTKPSVLRLSAPDIIAFVDKQDSIYTYKKDELLTKRTTVAVNEGSKSSGSSSGRKTVRIRKGDTLSTIARRNGTTVAKLKRLNPSIKGTSIRAGRSIRVR